MLDVRRLRLLREVHHRGTLHAAARALDYTPSAVSQQLQVLEREAGTPLLEKAGRGVRLTDAALALVARTERVVQELEAAQAELERAHDRVAGTVRVTSFQTAALHLVMPAIERLQREHPDVRVALSEEEVEQAVPMLQLGTVDVVLGDEYEGVPVPRPPGLTRRTLVEEEVLLLLPDHDPRRRIADLQDVAWATAKPGGAQRELVVKVCREAGFEPDLRHSTNDLLVLQALVRTGAATLLPELVGPAAGVTARRPQDARIGREVFALHRAANRPAVDAFLTALVSAAALPRGRGRAR